ncbi:NAD(P)-binding protein [Venturia nashicola]|nr:NAD(P)-binding protein [Venturia nashicola]
MEPTSYVSKVAIVGASGHLGQHFTKSLLATKKHTITAVTRTGSKADFPSGVQIAEVDYNDDGRSLISALRGHQFLIITMAATAPRDTHSKIVKAAAEAGVPYIMPNVHGIDQFNDTLRREAFPSLGDGLLENIFEIERLGASYIALVCGFWYEWSLALGDQWFGLDIKNKKVTFLDDGNTRIDTSTWSQCGEALAALLSLPEGGASPSLSEWKNKTLYIKSFTVSQRDMLDSIHRVTGSSDDDWEISYESSKERYEEGLKEMQGGVWTGFVKVMYTRNFYPGQDGAKEFANQKLALPEESLDEATMRAVEMVESGWNPFH